MFYCKYNNKSKILQKSSTIELSNGMELRDFHLPFSLMTSYHFSISNNLQIIISARIINKCHSMTTVFRKIFENILQLVYKYFISLFLKHNVQGGQGGNPLGHIYTCTKSFQKTMELKVKYIKLQTYISTRVTIK